MPMGNHITQFRVILRCGSVLVQTRILKKKKIQPDSFEINVDGELTETHPKYYKTIRVTYEFTGPRFQSDPIVYDKINQAVRLSRDIYCAISKMLKGSCEITDEIILHDS